MGKEIGAGGSGRRGWGLRELGSKAPGAEAAPRAPDGQGTRRNPKPHLSAQTAERRGHPRSFRRRRERKNKAWPTAKYNSK